MKEIWKDIKNYENLYQISNTGKIKCLPKAEKGYKEIIMKQQIDKNGYMRTNLSKNNKIKSVIVHRLVAQAFISNPNKYPCVNHKDENKQNNCVNNLEWCTYKYNNNYGSRMNKIKEKVRKKVGKYDLNGNLLKIYNSVFDAKKDNSVSAGTHISEACNGKRKTAYGYIWKHVN